MASHFEDPSYEMRTFGPHRPSSFLRYFTSINMVFFFVALDISAACAQFRSFNVAQLWHTMIVRRLVLATEVAFVVIVRIMVALSVVAVIATARLVIFRVVAALLVGVLGLVAMDMARLTRKLRWGILLGLVTFVVTVARHFIAAIVIVIVVVIVTA